MKNLLKKTLFISLLSLVVIPSGVQAGFSIEDGKKVAKRTLPVAVGVAVAVAAGVVRDPSNKEIEAIMGGVAGVAAAGVEAIGERKVREIIGSGIGTAVATTGIAAIVELLMAKKDVLKVAGLGTVGLIGIGIIGVGAIGAETGVAIIRKIAEKLSYPKNHMQIQ